MQAVSSLWSRTTAHEAVEKIASGAWSVGELMRQTMAAIAELDRELKAFTCLAEPQGAMAAAEKAAGPLRGLPLGVKDIFDTVDLPTRYGSSRYANGSHPTADAAIVSVARRAGAVVAGKTTTTEFAFLHPTATRNPAAPGHTPGGSSAGSAAAVAAGLLPWALGTQTAGSTIRPASYCGIVGFKPSFGLLPTPGLRCFSWSLDTVGLFARNVRDVALLAQALSGQAFAPAEDGRTQRSVAVLTSYPWDALTPSAAKAMEHGLMALERAGHFIKRLQAPQWLADVFAAHADVQAWEAARALAGERRADGPGLSAMLHDYLAQADQVGDEAYARAKATASRGRHAFNDWIGDCHFLLTPSAPDEAPAGLGSTGSSTFNRAWSLLGLPCVGVPGAVGTQGLPLGLQLIGRFGSDSLLVQAAIDVERSLRA
jgi:Asp-tRNA(Asn)/Glu-tRNA(Gln) amidotransferase A subunit family amidase